MKAKANANVGEDEPTPNHFYVLVRNTSNKSIRLGLKMSDWYDCLKFQVTAPDGKIFLIKRPATAWAANPAESWIFQAGEFRVFTIDFTSGRWEGFPPQDEIRSSIQYKIKASFGYYDSEAKKELSYDSNEITAENGW